MEILNAIKKTLSACWDGKEIPAAEKEAFKNLMKSATGRKLFGEALNGYRKNSMFSMKEKGYVAVSELLQLALDEIAASNDIKAALHIMLLAETFYLDRTTLEGKQEKIFLQYGMRKHPYWHNKGLWEQAIEFSIAEDLQNKPTEKESKEESDTRVANIIFGKLGAFVNNMLHFEVGKEEVEAIVLTYAKAKNLPEPYVAALQVFFELIRYAKKNSKR